MLDKTDMKKENKNYKIVIDTNIWISFLIGKRLKGLQNHINNQQVRILTCKEQLNELADVFSRPKIRKYISKEIIIDFFELLEESSQTVSINTVVSICRDPKDNYLLSLSIDSDAHFLVTGDNDLLILQNINNTQIIDYHNFEKILSKNFEI